MINIVGNAIFVFGFHWAVFGVALATLLSRIVAGIVITLLVCGKTNPIRIDKWSELKPDGSIIKKILAIGIPSGVENGMFQIGKPCCNQYGCNVWHGINCRQFRRLYGD